MGLPEDFRTDSSPPLDFEVGHGESTTAQAPNVAQPDPPSGPPTVAGSGSKPAPGQLPEDVCGLKLGHYELIRQLGVGGMAAVLLARDTQLDRLVALKVLPPANAQDPETLERFHQEAKSGAKLDHENIARVYSSGEDQGLHFLALEYVEGETLKSLIDGRGRLPLEQALPFLYQAALGLEHAASKGVVHRDIKPSNLLVTRDGKLKLVDLGLAKSLDARSEDALTRYGATLGTFDYLSPEQALDPRKADTRSDIYSLGCTFYHMLTGKSPVPDGSAAVKLAFHQQSRPVDPRRFCPDIPGPVVVLLDKMLEKKPENRYANPTELARAIESVASGLKINLQGRGLRESPKARLKLVLAVALVSIAVVGFWIISQLGSLDPLKNRVEEPRVGLGQKRGSGSKAGSGNPEGGSIPVPEIARFDNKDANAAELVDWLAANSGKDRLEVVLHGDMDLSDLPLKNEAGLLVSARDVLIRSAHPGRRATIRFQFDGRVAPDFWSMMALDAESVKIDGIRFILDTRESANDFRALELRGSRLSGVTIERCEFLQSGSPMDERRRVSSLAVACQGIAPAVVVRDSVFLGFKDSSQGDGTDSGSVRLFGGAFGGQDAILAKGYYREIRCENCLFGPHANFFRLEPGFREAESGKAVSEKPGGNSPGMPVPGTMIPGMTMVPGVPNPTGPDSGPSISGDGSVSILNSSFMMAANETLLAIQPGTSAAVTMRRCLVAPGKDGDRSGERTLVNLPVPSSRLWFVGRGNRFRGITRFLETGTEPKLANLEMFRAKLATDGLGSDEESIEIGKSPWLSNDPLGFFEEVEVIVSDRKASLGNLGTGIAGAFQPAPLPDLQWKEPSGLRFAGAEKFAGVPFFPSGNEKKATQSGRHLVIPGQTDVTRNIHPSLQKALDASKSGDVIAIRHSGPMNVDQAKLKNVGFEVTIRPDGESKPTLVFMSPAEGGSWIDLDRSLIILEDLSILVDQGLATKAGSLVSLSSQANCQLRDCSITLVGGNEAVFPYLGVISGGPMGQKPGEMFQAAQPARISLERCLVRGYGSLIRMSAVTPVELDINDSTLFLGRDLARWEATGQTSPSQATAFSVGVTKSTLVLGGSGVVVDGIGERSPPDWIVRSQHSKWISWTNPKNALVRVEGVLIRREKIKEWWKGGDNLFINWQGGVDIVDYDMQPKPLVTVEQWQEMMGDPGNEWPTWDLPPAPKAQEWATMTPEKIRGPEAVPEPMGGAGEPKRVP